MAKDKDDKKESVSKETGIERKERLLKEKTEKK